MTTPGDTRAPGQPERRRATRHTFDAVLKMEWGSAVLQGRVRDISPSGMFVELADPLWVGASFSAQLALDEPLRLECSVRRVEPGRGMAVTFVVPGEEGRVRLAEVLGTLIKK